MGRRKVKATLEKEQEDVLDPVEAIEQERDLKQRLEMDEWLTEFQGRFLEQPVKILIEKYVDEEWHICRRYALATFDHEAVRTEFGPGHYKATLIIPRGRYVPEGRNRFSIAESIIKDPEKRQDNPLENPAVAMMVESLKGQQAQMLEITKSMIAANQGGGKSDLGQLVTAMKGLQDLTPKEIKPMDTFKDTLTMLKLVKEVSGDSSESGGILSEIRKFLEVYPTIKEQLGALKPAIPAPAAPPAHAPTTERPTTMDPLTQKIVQLVPKYVDAAKKAAPVETWGDNLLEDFDNEILPLLLPELKKQYGPLVADEDDAYDVILKYAKDPNERAKIFTEIPPLAPHKEWVARTIDEAIRIAETDPESGATGVVDAVAGNGQASE